MNPYNPNNNPQNLQNAQQGLERANAVVNKGFMGWLTRLFMGKRFTNTMNATIGGAQQTLGNIQQQQQLMAMGVPATAVVLAMQETGQYINMQPVVIVHLRVSVPNYGPYDTEVQTMLSPVNMPRVNDTVNIKYNPQNGKEVVILGIAQSAPPQGYVPPGFAPPPAGYAQQPAPSGQPAQGQAQAANPWQQAQGYPPPGGQGQPPNGGR
jgi:hypothetical protein